MIIESIVNFLLLIPNLILDTVSITQLPIVSFSVIGEVLGYFSFYIGNDILLAIFATVTFWVGLKSTLGLMLFIYKLIPLT